MWWCLELLFRRRSWSTCGDTWCWLCVGRHFHKSYSRKREIRACEFRPSLFYLKKIFRNIPVCLIQLTRFCFWCHVFVFKHWKEVVSHTVVILSLICQLSCIHHYEEYITCSSGKTWRLICGFWITENQLKSYEHKKKDSPIKSSNKFLINYQLCFQLCLKHSFPFF